VAIGPGGISRCRHAEHAAYVVKWLAWAVQRPAEPAGVALALRSLQGAGKGLFVEYVGRLFGAHYLSLQGGEQLTGQFNQHIENKILIFADEIEAMTDRYAIAAVKRLITEPTINIEGKGRDIRTVPNVTHLVAASNEDWVVPAGLDNRRWCVLDVSGAHIGDRAYFDRLLAEMNGDGPAALLHDLQRVDLTGFDIRQFPVTDALREQQIRAMSPIQQWWFQKLSEGRLLPQHNGWMSPVPCEALHADYIAAQKKSGIPRRSTETELGMFLTGQLTTGLRKYRGPAEDFGVPLRSTPSRPYVWEFPDLATCRAAFDKKTGHRASWPPAEKPTLAKPHGRRSKAKIAAFPPSAVQPLPNLSGAKEGGKVQ